MIKIEAIIQPSRFEAVKEGLHEIGVEGMTVSEVRPRTPKGTYRDVSRPGIRDRPSPKDQNRNGSTGEPGGRRRRDDSQDRQEGKIGDGKIFLSPVNEAIRIRNEERGETAL
jgi:nitrogen regulatory protein P-II 1